MVRCAGGFNVNTRPQPRLWPPCWQDLKRLTSSGFIGKHYTGDPGDRPHTSVTVTRKCNHLRYTSAYSLHMMGVVELSITAGNYGLHKKHNLLTSPRELPFFYLKQPRDDSPATWGERESQSSGTCRKTITLLKFFHICGLTAVVNSSKVLPSTNHRAYVRCHVDSGQ